MARPLRIEYPGAWYHIMNRGSGKKKIFHSDKHRELFLELLLQISNRFQVEIHAYCLMDNHYHLLVRTPLGNISRAMRHLNGVYTQRINTLLNKDSAIFRGRYKSILVEADTYLLRLSRYIHLNPVDAGVVKKAEKYRWSSYSAYLSGKAPHWLNTATTLDYFGQYNRSKKYAAFVEEGVDKELDNFYKKIKRVPILGTEAFTKTVTQKYLQERHRAHEIPEHKSLKETVSPETIMSCVAHYFKIKKENLLKVKTKIGNRPRNIGMYLSQLIGQYKLNTIAEIFALSGAGVSHVCRRIELQMKNDLQLAKDILNLRKIIESKQ